MSTGKSISVRKQICVAREDTYEGLLLALVFDLNDGSALPANNSERPVLLILLDVGLVDTTTDETLGIEDGVPGVGVESVLGRLSDSANGSQSAFSYIVSLGVLTAARHQ